MFSSPITLFILLWTSILVRAANLVGGENNAVTPPPALTHTPPSARQVTPRIRLKADSWTAVWPLDEAAEDIWGGIGGQDASWVFYFDSDRVDADKHFSAYIYKSDNEAQKGDLGWQTYQDDHFVSKTEKGVQLQADKVLECTIIVDPEADVWGYFILRPTEPYLVNRDFIRGIKDFGCKEVKVDN